MLVSDIQWCRHSDSVSPLGQSLWMLVMHTPPIRPCFLHLCICISAAQLELTFRLEPFDTDGYQIVLSGSCHVRSSAGHTQCLIRGIHGSWWVMFFLSPAGPESSVPVSQSEEWGCVNRIKRNTVDLCICFALGFSVMNGIRTSFFRWWCFGLLLCNNNWHHLGGLTGAWVQLSTTKLNTKRSIWHDCW